MHLNAASAMSGERLMTRCSVQPMKATSSHGPPDMTALPGRAVSIEVALATYNSAPFLPELLDSLFAQTNQQFTLIAADDGSSDGTLDILARYASRYPGRIILLPRNTRPIGARGNFARLIDHAAADFLLPCDHDDVWLPNKIDLTLKRMLALEAAHSPETPLLVHTDLIVVGPELEVLGPSFFRYADIDPARNDLASLLTANVVTGCAAMANRALYERARPIPPVALMHDHWLALVAATFGAIAAIDEPTILYRQHGGNTIGAWGMGRALLIRRIGETLFSDSKRKVMMGYSRQAAALLARFGEQMSADARRRSGTLADLWSFSRWRRFALLRRSGMGLRGFVRSVALFIVVTRRGRGKES